MELVPTTSESPLCEACSNSSQLTSIIITASVTAFVTALLATVIFVLIQIVICKCHPKSTPSKTAEENPAGREEREYEQIDRASSEGGGADHDPAYMEIGRGKRDSAILLNKNEAYASIHLIT